MIGQVEDKDPKEMSYIKHLFTMLLLIREDTHTLSPQVCISALLLSHLNCFSVCSPTCCCAMSLIINSVLAFTVFASIINAFFTRSKSQGKIASSL